jgi:hypothetical protein
MDGMLLFVASSEPLLVDAVMIHLSPSLILFAITLGLNPLDRVALAGEAATLEVFGFSQDGRHFALIQSGIEDGSGLPFADLTVSEVSHDAQKDMVIPAAFARNFPGTAGPGSRLAGEAAGLLERLGLPVVPERQMAVQEIETNANTSASGETDDGRPITVIGRPFPSSDRECMDRGVDAMGLEIEINMAGAPPVLVRDEPKLADRGCPIGYRIAWLESKPVSGDGIAVAVVVAYERLGFEGPDLRYFAVARVL